MAVVRPPPELHPNEIIFAPLAKEQRKKLIFRNDTPHWLIARLHATVPGSVELKHEILGLPPHSLTENSFIYKPNPVSQSKPALLIFVRTLSSENDRIVRQWLAEPVVDKEDKRLAFKLDFHTTSDRFNAQKIILDLPGNASLDEGPPALPTDISTARSWPNLYQMARFEEFKRAQLPKMPSLPKPVPARAVETADTLWSLVEYMLLFLLFLIAVIKLQFLH